MTKVVICVIMGVVINAHRAKKVMANEHKKAQYKRTEDETWGFTRQVCGDASDDPYECKKVGIRQIKTQPTSYGGSSEIREGG